MYKYNNSINKSDHIEVDDSLKDEDIPVTSNSTSKLVVSSKEDLEATKMSQHTQTEILTNYMTQFQRNFQLIEMDQINFQQEQNIPVAPKHMVPCPFLKNKSRCSKGPTCEFSHDDHLYQPTVIRKYKLDFFLFSVPPFLQNLDFRLGIIEDNRTSSQPSYPLTAYNQRRNLKYRRPMSTHRQLRSEISCRPVYEWKFKHHTPPAISERLSTKQFPK